MAKHPAVVIVVRHGARLDAADKTWHLSSPAPYDPPLTYGGWIQSRALGLRIASLLREREREASLPGTVTPILEDSGLGIHDSGYSGSPKSKPKPKRHKVVIHSSPFQRCVQTSIGISAGLSQYEGLAASGRKGSETRIKTVNQLRASPKLHASDISGSPKLRPVPEVHQESRDFFRHIMKEQKKPAGATLRIDAFLGEWLSPDYFDMITPPPNSILMVAGAKAELLRRADAIDTFTPSSPKLSGNLWGGSQPTRHHAHSVSIAHPSPLSQDTDGPLESWKVFSRNVPRRSNSVGRNKSPSTRPNAHSSILKHDSSTGYTPPTPTYAISPGDAIPRGYVAHARDQCVEIDYQWDSMREPQMWGDGGVFGEEWSQMHKRFRHGVNSMVDWYGVNSPNLPRPHDEHEAVPEATLDDPVHHDDNDNDNNNNSGDEDEDEDLVVVLVTHGAGCNALIGALTNQPVLLDVGMASLTMAVQRSPSPNSSGNESPIDSPALAPVDGLGRPVTRRRSSFDLGLSSLYEMKLVASADHLRPGVDPSKPSTPAAYSPNLSGSQTVPQSRSRRVGSAASIGGSVEPNWNLPEPRARINSSLGSSRRPSRPVINTVVPSPILASPASSESPTGLWNSGSAKGDASPNLLNPLARSASVSSRLIASDSQAPERPVSPKGRDANTGAERNDTNSVILEEAQLAVSELPSVATNPPSSLRRSLSQKGLWGSPHLSSINSREIGIPKRRWTVAQD